MFGFKLRPQGEPLDLETAFKRIRLRAARLVGAWFLYIVVTRLLKAGGGFDEIRPLESISTIRYAFYALALMLAPLLAALKAKYWEPEGPNDQLPRHLHRGFLVLTGVLDAITTFGWIIFFLSMGNPLDLYILIAYALALLAIFYPRRQRWQEYAEHEAPLFSASN